MPRAFGSAFSSIAVSPSNVVLLRWNSWQTRGECTRSEQSGGVSALPYVFTTVHRRRRVPYRVSENRGSRRHAHCADDCRHDCENHARVKEASAAGSAACASATGLASSWSASAFRCSSDCNGLTKRVILKKEKLVSRVSPHRDTGRHCLSTGIAGNVMLTRLRLGSGRWSRWVWPRCSFSGRKEAQAQVWCGPQVWRGAGMHCRRLPPAKSVCSLSRPVMLDDSDLSLLSRCYAFGTLSSRAVCCCFA